MSRRVLVLFLACAAACTPVSMIDRKIEVSAAQFQDIPVPAGFRLVDARHESHSLALGEYRFGVFRYVGSGSVDSAASYVMERMPQHAWTLVERHGEGTDSQRIVFERDDYTAEYRVRLEESRTLIDVDVRTHARPIAKG
ncbi:MAG TPA: hypothetical protein VK081_09580 [Planctomycetota bacterium]|nr:hypothetical protein [Planctomycetota bacterium]